MSELIKASDGSIVKNQKMFISSGVECKIHYAAPTQDEQFRVDPRLYEGMSNVTKKS